MHDKILILDFGSQVTQLIARRVREAHVFCEIHPNDVSDAFVREFAPKGVILSGSHLSAYEEATEKAPKVVFELGVPVLLTDMDTFAAAETVSSYIGRSHFQQPEKVARFTTMLNEHMNFEALYASLGLKHR